MLPCNKAELFILLNISVVVSSNIRFCYIAFEIKEGFVMRSSPERWNIWFKSYYSNSSWTNLHRSLIFQLIQCILFNYCYKVKLTATVFFVLLLFCCWAEITEEQLVSFGHIWNSNGPKTSSVSVCNERYGLLACTNSLRFRDWHFDAIVIKVT